MTQPQSAEMPETKAEETPLRNRRRGPRKPKDVPPEETPVNIPDHPEDTPAPASSGFDLNIFLSGRTFTLNFRDETSLYRAAKGIPMRLAANRTCNIQQGETLHIIWKEGSISLPIRPYLGREMGEVKDYFFQSTEDERDIRDFVKNA